MEASLLPIPKIQFYGATGTFQGKPLAGGKLYTYVAGSYTVLQATYTDSTATTQNANPVILDSNGMADVWIAGYYNIALYDANDVLQYTEANVSSFAAGNIVTTQWQPVSLINLTYFSGAVFTCATDMTATFVKGGRILATVTAGNIVGTIVSAVYGSVTTVTCLWDDGGALDSGLSAINTGIITTSLNCIPVLPVKTKTGSYTLTIDDINQSFIFTGASPSATLPAANTVPSNSKYFLKHIGSGNLTVVGTVDATTNPIIAQYGSVILFSDGTNWYELYRKALSAVNYQSANKTPTAPASTSVYAMQGLAGTITPARTGNVLVIITGTVVGLVATTVDNGISYQISYGTSTAPANAAALTGTQVGPVQTYTSAIAPTAYGDVNVPFSISALISALTVGTAYWIDLAAESITTASQMGLTNVQISIIEQ
jgi:hypothetical protein